MSDVLMGTSAELGKRVSGSTRRWMPIADGAYSCSFRDSPGDLGESASVNQPSVRGPVFSNPGLRW